VPDRPVELEGLRVVVLGSFNPAIFHPSWLSMNNLLRSEEAEEAKVEIISSEATVFTASWCSFQVLQHNMMIASTDPTKQAPLLDLILGVFQLLEHTPVDAFGLNRDRHYRMESLDKWHKFGHFLAPKASWDGIIQSPGLKSLEMQGRREGDETDTVTVKIEPSIKVTPNGLYMNVHRHYTVSASEREGKTAAKLCKLLRSSWQDFLTFTECVSADLFRRFDETPE
jgi:hypothetical protein